MGYNPFEEKGIPLAEQTQGWLRINRIPFNKNEVHPLTRIHVILMNSIEFESVLFSHQFSRNVADRHVKRVLAEVRRVEQQQQKEINWLVPADQTVAETAIAYEQLETELTAAMARQEPDDYLRGNLEFTLLEDLDHLYRLANLFKMIEKRDAVDITGSYTEVIPGRPSILQHRHPADTIANAYDDRRIDSLTALHAVTILAVEQQTLNFYMNFGPHLRGMVGRNLFQEIAQVEEQHVSRYESLIDPASTWYQRLVTHEYNECWWYHTLMELEIDERVRQLWQEQLAMEVEHLHVAADLMRKYERRDPQHLFPRELPSALSFGDNVEYVREVTSSQVSLTSVEGDLVSLQTLPKEHRYFRYQEAVNREGVPSQTVLVEILRRQGQDYRFETAGPHPVESFRRREQREPAGMR
jgi:rubrerythrin